ncbi:predicted protein [Histoplasma capsulatum G186AR]|uniref:Uncharacterized protein n=1 Tax=Ajellomyces capsulatus (strain G186AR / H82 / ATCC MYA-2454 / RMSCC 2432) TaxID=447093 RepID=C0NR14_AJECG|nr:uncharacterized protein HCBG_05444 [Histoplasma capsulatum G186AR]EEH06128.1 predicted protein [Histoplasma capsulatum G186AR]
MHAADFVLPPSIMKQDDLSSQGRRWIRPNSREIRPPETPVVDFESVAEIPRPTACYVMGYVEESELSGLGCVILDFPHPGISPAAGEILQQDVMRAEEAKDTPTGVDGT